MVSFRRGNRRAEGEVELNVLDTQAWLTVSGVTLAGVPEGESHRRDSG
jgi:hypothetical protein